MQRGAGGCPRSRRVDRRAEWRSFGARPDVVVGEPTAADGHRAKHRVVFVADGERTVLGADDLIRALDWRSVEAALPLTLLRRGRLEHLVVTPHERKS